MAADGICRARGGIFFLLFFFGESLENKNEGGNTEQFESANNQKTHQDDFLRYSKKNLSTFLFNKDPPLLPRPFPPPLVFSCRKKLL